MLRKNQQPCFQKAMDSNHDKRFSEKVNQSMKNYLEIPIRLKRIS